MDTLEFSNEEIVKALKICAVSDGSICCYCAYSKIAGGKCSRQLMIDAADRLEGCSENEKGKQTEEDN